MLNFSFKRSKSKGQNRMAKIRLSNFELIRILAMFLIVLHHSIVHGVCDVSDNLSNVSAHWLNGGVAYVLGSGGKIGVFLFVLITGYFMLYSKISLGKIIKVWFPVFFWSVLLFICFDLFESGWNLKSFVRAIFPIIFGEYWFMTTYVFMYLLIPFLNKVAVSVNTNFKKIYFLMISFIILISNFSEISGLHENLASNLAYFCIIYIFGALLRKDNVLNNNTWVSLAKKVFIIFIFLDIIVIMSATFLGSRLHKMFFFGLAKEIVVNYWSLIPVVLSIALFVIIGSKKIKYNSVINQIAATTFGIYLISDNQHVQSWLWHSVFHMGKMLYQPILVMILYVFGVSILVFCVCGLLDFIRELIFKKFENSICFYFNKLQKKIMIRVN